MLADDRPGPALVRQRVAVQGLLYQFHRSYHPALPYIRHQRVVAQMLQAVLQVRERGGQALQGLFLFKDLQAGQCGSGG